MKIKTFYKKQSVLYLILTIILFSCQYSHTENRSIILNDKNENQLKKEFTEYDSLNTLKLHVKINNTLAIGWGLTYNCNVVSVLEGKIPENNNTIIIYISVGSKYYSYEDPVLKLNNEYIITFFRYLKSETDYIPTGTTGFMDKTGYVWLISSIENSI